VGQIQELPYGFDLPEDQRPQAFTIPTKQDHPSARADGNVCHKWDPTHAAYLFQLMELAVAILNRQLKPVDFRPITEALHRQFRHTVVPPAVYPERGWNNVHTYMDKTRREEFNAIESRVLLGER
jgi:hypothetical protein